MPIEIVDFPIKNVDFHVFMVIYLSNLLGFPVFFGWLSLEVSVSFVTFHQGTAVRRIGLPEDHLLDSRPLGPRESVQLGTTELQCHELVYGTYPITMVYGTYPMSLWFHYGWWLTYPSEKYDFVSWDDDIPNQMEK